MLVVEGLVLIDNANVLNVVVVILTLSTKVDFAPRDNSQIRMMVSAGSDPAGLVSDHVCDPEDGQQ